MDKCIFNKSNSLWYELVGDYYLPCLKLPEEEQRFVGIWGQRRRQYLREHRKALYNALLLSGKLDNHLADIDQQAENMFSQMVKQMAAQEDITEQLKADSQIEWVGRMNNIRQRTEEIINTELIYS
ncbi:MAG: TnpV protein [Oscillospiraceae bacterium]|nr:TnpV protein [Oscillospiraceae bacterium]